MNGDDHKPKLLFKDIHPLWENCLFVLGFFAITMVLFDILSGNFFRELPLEDPTPLVLVAIVIVLLSIIGLIAIPIALWLYRRAYVYSTGIIPGYRTIQMLFRPNSYFIPYSEIEVIGYRGQDPEHPMSYYFLMRDGSLAFCTLPEKQEGKRILAEQLKTNCPDAAAVRLRVPFLHPGIRPKDMVRQARGENAPIRFYAPR